MCIYIYIINIHSTHTYSALQKYWNGKYKMALLAVESRHLQIWFKDEYETKLQNVTFYYWVIQHIDVLPAKRFSTFRVSSLSDVSISIGTVTVLSQVFLSDQLCPVAFILQILKAGNVSYQLYPYLCILNLAFDDDTHKPGWRQGSWLWEKSKQFGC